MTISIMTYSGACTSTSTNLAMEPLPRDGVHATLDQTSWAVLVITCIVTRKIKGHINDRTKSMHANSACMSMCICAHHACTRTEAFGHQIRCHQINQAKSIFKSLIKYLMRYIYIWISAYVCMIILAGCTHDRSMSSHAGNIDLVDYT